MTTLQIENPKSKTETRATKNPYAPPRPYVPAARKLRVLLISHTCQSRTEGQPKAHALANLPDLDLHLLTPARWLHYGKWRPAQPPLHPNPTHPTFQTTIAPIRLPWLGPAQSFLHYYPSLPKILRTFRPDVIDLWEEPWSYVSAHTCRMRNRLLPTAKIVSETEQNIYKELPFPFESFRTYTLKNTDLAIARSPEALQILRQKGHHGPGQVVPNAVDVALFRPMNRAECREKLQEALSKIENRTSTIESPFIAGYIGRLVPEKGLTDLCDALPFAPQNAHVLFIGDGPLAPELHAQAARLNISHRVHFLPNQPLENLPALMNALDVLVLPSRTTRSWKEQFGRVLIEAGACRIPVIGSDSGAIPDVISGAGLLAPEQNPQALANAFTTLARDPCVADSLAQHAYENAHTCFTWEKVAQTMARLYHSLY